MNESSSYVLKMFSSIASRYDLLNTILSFNRDKYWRKFAVSKTRLRDGESVLDVATGTGDLALELTGRVGSKGRVTGVDFCENMLANARYKLKRNGYQNVEFILANAEALPFPNNTFDCTTISFGLRNMADIEQTLREMTRVLKVGGRLVSLEFSQPPSRAFNRIHHLYIFGLLPLLGWLMSGNRDAYDYLPRSIEEFPSPVQIRQIMENLGLRNIEVCPLTFGTVTVHVGTKKGR